MRPETTVSDLYAQLTRSIAEDTVQFVLFSGILMGNCVYAWTYGLRSDMHWVGKMMATFWAALSLNTQKAPHRILYLYIPPLKQFHEQPSARWRNAAFLKTCYGSS
jgi:hypothetical protein